MSWLTSGGLLCQRPCEVMGSARLLFTEFQLTRGRSRISSHTGLSGARCGESTACLWIGEWTWAFGVFEQHKEQNPRPCPRLAPGCSNRPMPVCRAVQARPALVACSRFNSQLLIMPVGKSYGAVGRRGRGGKLFSLVRNTASPGRMTSAARLSLIEKTAHSLPSSSPVARCPRSILRQHRPDWPFNAPLEIPWRLWHSSLDLRPTITPRFLSPKMLQRNADAHGRSLKAISGSTGNHSRPLHDYMPKSVATELERIGAEYLAAKRGYKSTAGTFTRSPAPAPGCSSRQGAQAYQWHPSGFAIGACGAKFSELL